MLGVNLDGWDGLGVGREVQEGGDICILLCCDRAQINTTL